MKSITKVIGMLIASFCFGIVSVNAQILDQSSPYGPPCLYVGYNAGASSLTWQQEITVGIAGQLWAIELYVNNLGSAQLFINRGAPWQSDPNDYESIISGTSIGWNMYDLSAAGLFFDVGEKFVLGIHGLDQNLGIAGNYILPDGCYPGKLWLNGVVYSDGGFDFGFRTYVMQGVTPTPTDTPTPIPTDTPELPTNTPTVIFPTDTPTTGPTPTPLPIPAMQPLGLGILFLIFSVFIGLISLRRK